MAFRSRAAPVLAGLVLLAPPVSAQHAEPCPYLIETIEARAQKISAAEARLFDILADDTSAIEGPRTKTCAAARNVIAQADELRKFVEPRRSRCPGEGGQGVLDAALSLGSASTAQSLAKTYCGG